MLKMDKADQLAEKAARYNIQGRYAQLYFYLKIRCIELGLKTHEGLFQAISTWLEETKKEGGH